MGMTVEQITAEALLLPREARAFLVARLWTVWIPLKVD